MFWILIIWIKIIFYWKFFNFKFSSYFKTEKNVTGGFWKQQQKIEPPYSSNLGGTLEAFLDHLMPIRKVIL